MFHINLVTELVKGSTLRQHCCAAKLQSCAEQERGGGSVKRDRPIDLCVKGRSPARARIASSVIRLRNKRPEYFMVSHQIGTGRQRSPRLIRPIFQYQIERVQYSKPNTRIIICKQQPFFTVNFSRLQTMQNQPKNKQQNYSHCGRNLARHVAYK